MLQRGRQKLAGNRGAERCAIWSPVRRADAAKVSPPKEKWSPHPPETWQIALRSLRIFLAMLSKRQAEAICQCLKGILGHLLRLLAKLAVEAGIIVGIHAALKNPSLH